MNSYPLPQADLERRLGYAFRDGLFLLTALTHPSYAGDHHVAHYQRLEFLGDAVLELTISRILYTRFPSWPEGRLTRTRAELVREETVSDVARTIDLGAYIRLSPGEEHSGVRSRSSILCDVMEAVLGAIYLDGGFEAAFQLISSLWESLCRKDMEIETLDSKTRLQEILQRTGRVPEYELLAEEGPAHCPSFSFRVCVNGTELGRGKSGSKQRAQQEAARDALAHLELNNGEDHAPCD